MMELQSVTDIIKQAEALTKSPENYLTAQEDVATEIRELTKKLYDFNKHSDSEKKNQQVLDELVIENLDEEQVWQQIELQNNFICKEFVADIAKFLVNRRNLILGSVDENEESGAVNGELHEDGDEDESGIGEEEADEDDDGEDSNLAISDEEENENDEEEEEEDDDSEDEKVKVKGKKSIVDDKFFKLSEMEEFLVAQEREKPKDDDDDDDEENEDEEIDLFDNLSSGSDEEKEGPHYNDFFDQPDDGTTKRKRKKDRKNTGDTFPSKKKVKFTLENDEKDGSDFDFDDDEEEEEDRKGDKQKDVGISSFEARQERLKSRIKALEEEALKEKPWQLKGEVTGTHRPQNSLLEEYVEFDTAARPPPVMTEKTTLKLEDIIIQRIKDKAWDDVERKIKPVEDPREYKKRLVLDQEKSKLSLAQIYEQEYLKQKEAKTGTAEDQPEKVPEEQIEINKMMKSLFAKLDALSNFHFTPKMVTTEVKVVSNLPAITVEEVAPVGTSDAALLAPEEIKSKPKGELIGKSERTKTDKKRERRVKKKRQGIKQKEVEKREKEKKTKVEKEKEFSKKKKISNKVMKKLGRNVSQVSENGDGKYIRSSNAFFSKLQDEVKSHIKTKSNSNNLDKAKKIDIKKLKL
ncbi:UNVERIFIED_CONTAM: hypothetical protein PYX00_000295 [Menopon gallinae]|uniref:U3 small nucleolar ribonucleoprotein protein MPP10 n=1 Tax=Menopon gallinae TaxID=328185 RepID=A0AAW2I9D6_9NEOP